MQISPPGPRQELGALALVAAVAAALYAPTLGHGFAFDDVSEVVRNEYVRSLASLPRIFAGGAWEGAGERNAIYRPLTTVTYALNHAAGGLAPAGYHAVNIVMHALASVLVALLARRIGASLLAAGAAGLLFAVHPVHVEVVANVAGRKDALATVLVLATLLAHRAGVRRGGAWLAAGPLAFAAALFSKETGVAALPIVVAWDVLVAREDPRSRRRAATYAVYAVEAALYLLARRAAVGSFGVPLFNIPYLENPLAHAGAGERLLTSVAVLGQGLLLQAFPARLSPDYSYDAIPLVRSVADLRFLLAAAVLSALAAAVTWAGRRWRPGVFLAAWYLVAIFPASNLLVKVGTVFGERLLYLPSVATCVAAGALLDAAPPRLRRGAIAALAAALLLLAGRTVAYSATWSDEVSLFSAAVRAQPRSAKAHRLLGAALMEQGRVDEGLAELERAVGMMAGVPDRPAEPRIDLGVAYERAGRVPDAAGVYEGVLRDHPEQPDALWRLGVVRWATGAREEAIALWRRAIAAAPDHVRAMTDLGLAAFDARDLATAEALWRRAVELDPRTPGAWLGLGNLYAARGERARARAAWLRFVEVARYGAYARERELVLQRLRAEPAGRAD